VLAKHKADIEEQTINAPTALTNVALAYNGTAGTLDTRADIPELLNGSLKDPATFVCNLLGETVENGLCKTLSGILDGALPRTAAASAPVAAPERVNTTFSQMLGVN